MRPTAHSLSFASPKESKQRKGEPDSSPGCAGTLRCSTGAGCAETRLSPQTPAPLIRPRLRYSPPHNGGEGRQYQQPNSQTAEQPKARHGAAFGACAGVWYWYWILSLSLSLSLSLLPPPFKAGLSSAGARGSGLALFEAIAEFSQPPLHRAAQGTAQRPCLGLAFLCLLSLAKQRK